jgi:hypothetical protein
MVRVPVFESKLTCLHTSMCFMGKYKAFSSFNIWHSLFFNFQRRKIRRGNKKGGEYNRGSTAYLIQSLGEPHVFIFIILIKIFERVLYIWAIRHPASGYVQGINDLVTPFFIVFLSEFIPDGYFFLNLILQC